MKSSERARSATKRVATMCCAMLSAAALLVAGSQSAYAQSTPDALNMNLVGANNLGGATGGEGFAMRVAPRSSKVSKPGDRYLFAATEAFGDPVACFSVIDVQNPAVPTVAAQVPIQVGGAAGPGKNATPPATLRCNSLDLAGTTLAVAQEVSVAGAPGAGVLFYDVSDPAAPKLLSYFNTAGGFSRGTHHVWFSKKDTLWVAGGAGNTAIPSLPNNPFKGQVFIPKRPTLDHQFPQEIDVSNPANPREVTRWYYPGVSTTDPLPAPDAIAGQNSGVRAHDIVIFPQAANRAYIGMLDGGIVIADISNRFHVRPISIMKYRGPGFTHTVLPLLDRQLIEVSEEAVGNQCSDGPKRASVWSIRDERLPVFLGAAPFLNTTDFCAPTTQNTGRYGSHNFYEFKPFSPGWFSNTLMLDAFFRGGLRVFDIANPFHIKDVAHYIPAFNAATNTTGAIQINDVFVDDRALVYIVDRFGDGLYILNSPLIRCNPGQCHT